MVRLILSCLDVINLLELEGQLLSTIDYIFAVIGKSKYQKKAKETRGPGRSVEPTLQSVSTNTLSFDDINYQYPYHREINFPKSTDIVMGPFPPFPVPIDGLEAMDDGRISFPVSPRPAVITEKNPRFQEP